MDMNHHEHHHHSPEHHGHGNPFLIPFILILVFAVIEFFGGVWTQSLALLGDAWHMFSDVVALGIAMFASYQATKAGESRAELVASIVNALAMLIVVAWIIVEAVERIASPRPVTGGYVMLIAFVGLVVNLLAAKYLHHHGDAENMNQRAAFLHVMGDILGSVAALAAGAIIYFTGWLTIDPVLSIFISISLLVVTLNLIREIWRNYKAEEAHSHHSY
jgi:cobalt-zinc-cadmium efflux system protein